MPRERRVSPRVVAHVERLREAGLRTEAFFSALVELRDDSALSTPQREAIYRMIGVESYIWYLEALRGDPIDRVKLMQEAKRIAEKNDVAIKKRTPGDSSLELATADLGRRPAPAGPAPAAKAPARAPRAPDPATTVNMRPPPRKK